MSYYSRILTCFISFSIALSTGAIEKEDSLSLKSVNTASPGINNLPDTIVTLENIEILSLRPSLATSQTLKGEELQSLSSTSIADALKYFAGVQIKDYGGLGGLKTLNVRSMGAQHTGVYIDGVRITNAQNGTVDLGKFSLSTLESVSLYNANKLETNQTASEYASGATVYLRTRRPQTDSLSILGGLGSFHTYRARVNAQISRKGWDALIDTEYVNSKGDYPFRYKSKYEDTIGRRRNSDIEYWRLESVMFHGDWSAHAYTFISERGCPGGVVRRLSDKYTNIGREWDTDVFIQTAWNHVFNIKNSLKFIGRYSYEYLRYNTDFPDNQNTARVDNHYFQHDGYLAAAYTFRPFSPFFINFSYDVRLSRLKADLRNFSSIFRLDQKAVVAAEFDWKGFSIAASALFQFYKDKTKVHAGAADPIRKLTPAFTLAYSFRDLTIRAWYKNIFRVPTLNDLYYTQAGNRELKPEFTKQWNLGVEYHLTEGRWIAGIQADIYINRVKDRIVCIPLRGTYTWSMMNYGETYCRGLNSTISNHISLSDWNLSLLGSLTWQDDLNRTDPSDFQTYNKPICYSPEFSCGLTGIVSWRRFSATVSWLHVGPRMWSYADPEDILSTYDNIDLKFTGIFRNWMATLEIFDLADIQYEHVPRYPMPGRNIRFSLTFSI